MEGEQRIERKPKSNGFVITILILLLIVAIFFIGKDFYSDKIDKVERNLKETCNQNITTSFEEGRNIGQIESVAAIMEIALDCNRNPIPLALFNQTVSIVNIACLQR